MRLSRSGVEFHRGNILRKLGLKRDDPQLGAALSTLLFAQSGSVEAAGRGAREVDRTGVALSWPPESANDG